MKKAVATTFEGHLKADDLRIAIVCARFNEFFVSQLLSGAIDCILRHGGTPNNIDTVWVPGSFEIPLIAQKLALTKRYHCILALGVIIQGATSHAEQIQSEVASGIAAIGLKTGVPVIHGIVAANNLEQAIERSGSKAGNRGWAAAAAGIEMANLIAALDKIPRGGAAK